MIMSIKQSKIKIEPRIKLNHNINYVSKSVTSEPGTTTFFLYVVMYDNEYKTKQNKN